MIRKTLVSLVTLSTVSAACGVAPTASQSETLSSERQSESALVAKSRSRRVVVEDAKATVREFLGGLGWRFRSADLELTLVVTRTEGEIRFLFDDGLRTHDLHLNGGMQWVENLSGGKQRFRVSLKGLTSLEKVKVKLLMPAKYNETPNIGVPHQGWYGEEHVVDGFNWAP